MCVYRCVTYDSPLTNWDVIPSMKQEKWNPCPFAHSFVISYLSSMCCWLKGRRTHAPHRTTIDNNTSCKH